MSAPCTLISLLDVVAAVREASSSNEEAARVVCHLLNSGQVRFRVSLVSALRASAHDAL